MISAGIKEIKNNLSRYLLRVKAGEEVVITERGRPVARIIQEYQKDRSTLSALAPLVEKGLITLPSLELSRGSFQPVGLEGAPLSEMILEDRR